MGYALDNLRVLVVDRNLHIRELMRTILASVGAQKIDLAGDSTAAFESFCAGEYDVVITDSELEPISGLDLVARIRTSTSSLNPYVPIIMLSAHADKERVRLARDGGVTEFLAKPFTVDTVLTRLEAVIENPRPFVRTRSYFGPDRRRKSSLDYSGPERRRSKLAQVSVSKHELVEQRRAALAAGGADELSGK